MNPDELEAHLRRTLREVAATVTPADEASIDPIASPVDGGRYQGRGRQQWLAAVAAVLLAVVVGAATLRNTTVHPAAELAGGSWQTMSPSPLNPRLAPTVAWTGREMIVTGGYDVSGQALADGAAYDPRTDSWRSISPKPGLHDEPVLSPWHFNATPAVVIDEQIITLADPGVDDESGWSWDLVAYDIGTDTWTTLDRNLFTQLPTDELVQTAGNATVHGVQSMIAWRDRLVVFGWRSDLSMFGWAQFDPASRAWTDFTAVDGADDLYGYEPSVGSPSLIDDRYFVLLFELGAPRPHLGVVVDLERGTAQMIPSPVDPEIFNSGIWSNGTAGRAAAGIAISNEGQARREAYLLDPPTATLTPVTAPSAGPMDDGPGVLVNVPGGYMTIGGLEWSGRSGGLEVESVVLLADDAMTRWVEGPEAPIDINRTGHTAIWTGTQVIVWGGAATTPDGPVNVASQPLTDGALFTPGVRSG